MVYPAVVYRAKAHAVIRAGLCVAVVFCSLALAGGGVKKECAKCLRWQAQDRERAVVAPCEIDMIRRPEFWQVCEKFTPANAPTVAQQSQCRPADDPPTIMGVQIKP